MTRPIGIRIKTARQAAGLTQQQLATAAKVSQVYVSHLEIGRYRNPSVGVLMKLAKALKMSAVTLLGEDL